MELEQPFGAGQDLVSCLVELMEQRRSLEYRVLWRDFGAKAALDPRPISSEMIAHKQKIRSLGFRSDPEIRLSPRMSRER